jgi:hypothetical protein
MPKREWWRGRRLTEEEATAFKSGIDAIIWSRELRTAQGALARNTKERERLKRMLDLIADQNGDV